MRMSVILALTLLSGCGGPRALDDKAGSIRITLEESTQAVMAAADLMEQWARGEMSIFTTPTALSSFDCFAANVTGPGIVPDTRVSGCTSPSNFGGPGIGATSDIMPRGSPLQVRVSSGTSRQIDVFGMYPRPLECGGSASSFNVYALGRKVVDITDDAAVSIPISLSTTTVASCQSQSGGPIILTPSSMYKDNSGTCSLSTTTSGGLSAIASTVANAGVQDNVGDESGCTGTPATGYAMATEYYFGATGIGNPTNIRITWRGRMGLAAHPYSFTDALSAAAGGIFIYQSGSWTSFSVTPSVTTASTYQTLTATLPWAGTMIYGGASIVIRVVGFGTAAAGFRISTDTDYIAVSFE